MVTLIIVAVIVLLVLLSLWRASRFVRVPQEQRIVIYRFGRFNRVEGPGLVKIIQGAETIERDIYVRDQQLDFSIDGLFIYGVPFGYRLNMWCRYDIQDAAGGDREKLKDFAQFDDSERYRAVAVKMQEALRESIKEYEIHHPLSPRGTTFVDRLLPILPGTEGSAEILNGTRKRLSRMLPTIGVILNTTHSINIISLILGQQIINDFQRGRTIQLFREQLPDLPIEALIQMLASIEGIEHPQIERLLLDHRTNDNVSEPARVDIRRSSDGRRDVRIRLPSSPNEPDDQMEMDEEDETDNSSQAAPAQSPDIYRITAEDASVLKPVPPRNPGWRQSA
jgi:hypothetical protein